MTVPAFSPPKLSFWPFVKESYAQLKQIGVIVRASAVSFAVQAVLILWLAHSVMKVVRESVALDALPESQAGEHMLAIGLAGFGIPFLVLAILILALPLRSALYRWQLNHEELGFIHPLKLGRQEWLLVWYQIKMAWYLALPMFVIALTTAFMSVLFTVLGVNPTEAQMMGGPFLLMLPLNALLLIGLMLWLQKRMAVLCTAFPAIYDNQTPRMWADIWHASKNNRWNILWGAWCIPLDPVTWMMGQGGGKDAAKNLLAFYDIHLVQFYIAAVLVIILGFTLLVAKIAYEVRCYRFLKDSALNKAAL